MPPEAPSTEATAKTDKDIRQTINIDQQNNLQNFSNEIVKTNKSDDRKTKVNLTAPLKLLFLNDVKIIEINNKKITKPTKIFFKFKCFFIVSINLVLLIFEKGKFNTNNIKQHRKREI